MKRIFTIGHQPMLQMSDFLNHLLHYGVNCVVDIRSVQKGGMLGEFDATLLSNTLKENNIIYLSFLSEFLDAHHLTQRGGQHFYEKSVATDGFLKGINRLDNGMNKRFCIALLGSEINPSCSFRASVIGRYLNNLGWEVCHIQGEGGIIMQEELIQKVEATVEERAEQKRWNELVGHSGEEIAALYLIQQGYTILDANWNLHHGCELDIVAFKDNVIHAIEVKTRKSDAFIAPEQAINDAKLRNINKALREYRYKYALTNLPYQVDSIAIVMRSQTDYTIKMYENLVRRTKKYY